jgi:predicted enzyme related to lactoylglutathione lyase
MDEFVKGLVWVGTRTEYFEEMVAFYRDTLRLSLHHEEGEFAIFRLPDGSKAEVFGPSDTEHTHFSTGPVAGFLVDDVDGARKKIGGGKNRVHRPRPRVGTYGRGLVALSGP